MEELKVKVGDKLIYRGGFLHNNVEIIVEVTKITPTGRIRIKPTGRTRIDYSNYQFDKYGVEIGKRDSWTPKGHLSIPTDEDYKRIKENQAINKACFLISNVKKSNIDYDKALKIIEILGG